MGNFCVGSPCNAAVVTSHKSGRTARSYGAGMGNLLCPPRRPVRPYDPRFDYYQGHGQRSAVDTSQPVGADGQPVLTSKQINHLPIDEFLHKADKRLEIKVEKSWFGLGSSPSPVRIKVRTGGTSDESSDDARDRDVDESSPTSKMTGVTRPLRTPGGSASKKWPSPASVVKSASRAENRAAAEFIAAAEEAARRSASTTPGKGGKGGSAVQSPAQRREERKRFKAEAEAAARRSHRAGGARRGTAAGASPGLDPHLAPARDWHPRG